MREELVTVGSMSLPLFCEEIIMVYVVLGSFVLIVVLLHMSIKYDIEAKEIVKQKGKEKRKNRRALREKK